MRNRNTLIGLIIVIVVLLGLITWKLITNEQDQLKANAELPQTDNASTLAINTPQPTAPAVEASPIPTITPLPAPDVYPEATVEEQQAYTAEYAMKAPADPPTIEWTRDKDAVFRLDSDPRIIRTTIFMPLVKRDEEITIFFQNAMDRKSVEDKIKEMSQSNHWYRVYPKLLMHWSSDTELHIKVLASKVDTLPNLSDRFYIDVSGSKRQDGYSINRHLFVGSLVEPSQIWQAAIDLSSLSKISDFVESYDIEKLDLEGKYYLLNRKVNSCYECDAQPVKYLSLYDSTKQKKTDYPFEIQLTTNYRGSGNFRVDKRGFFYEVPKAVGVKAPVNDPIIEFNLTDFVHGAAFTRDAESIILITGPQDATAETKLTIRWIDLTTRKETVLKEVVSGGIPQSQVDDTRFPISFIDDGTDVYFALYDYQKDEYIRYRLNWKSQQLTNWTLTVPPDKWRGFESSDDGKYRLYTNYALYRHQENEDQLLKLYEELGLLGSVWIPQSHDFLGISRIGAGKELTSYGSIVRVNADTMQQTNYANTALLNPRIVMISKDGKTVYLTAKDAL
ncbi:hypothetical protein E0485_15715 [Paenibacillus albiflavus]|uniref:Uncharacterized protein n=1 Tax=Paenibacillus albiflavus TaxID=2545760 RepID=A0A4R4ECD0_9BACL|nr:hypothetical protein [Paenibacillus albiflavus]TCZ75821.1 hypothetical protein E0485_15715 [Paenibacillus albiflavus]